MELYLKKLYYRIRYFFDSRELKMKMYAVNKHIIIGNRTDTHALDILINSPVKGHTNVSIGNDSIIHGEIVLYRHDSKVTIGDRVYIGPGTKIYCYDSVEIKDDVMISWGCTLIDTNAHSLNAEERRNDVLMWAKGWQYKDWSNVKYAKIIIENNSWIGFNSIITKGVVLEENVVVGAGSVVTKKVERNAVVAGNPAQLIKQVE
jgi:acetyltransferase-like isoleucine patch superfamily enzyme